MVRIRNSPGPGVGTGDSTSLKSDSLGKPVGRAARVMRRLVVIVSRTKFEESRGTLTATDAHRDDAMASLAADHFVGNCANEASAGHAKRMADGDGATVDVEVIRINAQAVAAIDDLDCEGLVQFPQIDVTDS